MDLTRNDFSINKIEFFTYFFYACEGICFLDFLAQFCLEYQGFDDPNPVRQITLTAKRYASNEMIWDLIPLIPFTLFAKFKHSRLLFLVKTIRIKKSLSLLDTKKFNKIMGYIQRNKLDKICKDPNSARAQDIIEDNT